MKTIISQWNCDIDYIKNINDAVVLPEKMRLYLFL